MSTVPNRRYFAASPRRGATENLLELASEVRTRLFLAHVRAGTGTPVQQTNCHPFRYRNWLFVHNGHVGGYQRLRRDLLFAVRPDLFGNITGSTNSELMFHLALTFGLTDDPIAGIARMAGFVEAAAAAAGVDEPALQMTIGVSDGARLYAARYASGPEVNTLFVSEDPESVRMLYPDSERPMHFDDDARVVVSEPLTQLPGAWREVPAGTALIIGEDIEERPFQPISVTELRLACPIPLLDSLIEGVSSINQNRSQASTDAKPSSINRRHTV